MIIPNNTEEWRGVKDYEGIYMVSNLGRIKGLARTNPRNVNLEEKIKTASIGSHGYLTINLYKHGIHKTRTVHQIVAQSFLNHKPNKYSLVVNHKNFNKLDNRLENLELVSQRENTSKKHIKSTSKYVGVSWRKNRNKWIATIVIDGKTKYLGSSSSEEEARDLYINKLKEIRK